MKDMLEKMMMKSDEPTKSKSGMSEMEKQAKMDVLMELLGLADSEMGNRVKSGMDEMQKVTVAAPDEKSLLAGLEKAEDVLEEKVMPETEDEESEDESEEELNLAEGGLITNNDNHPLEDEKTKEAMDENFTTKADSNPVEADEEDSMFGKKKVKKSANRNLYLGDD